MDLLKKSNCGRPVAGRTDGPEGPGYPSLYLLPGSLHEPKNNTTAGRRYTMNYASAFLKISMPAAERFSRITRVAGWLAAAIAATGAAYLIASALRGPPIPQIAVGPAAVALALREEPAPGVPIRHTGQIAGADWTIFKGRFIREDGQLIDSYSKLSHSEGQGYAMLLALAAGDRATFDQVWHWTRANLKRRDDALLAWKWQPDGKGGGAIGDVNDATDADILIAWALHRAAQAWHEPDYDKAARPIAEDILTKLVREVAGFAVLLPGHAGFAHKNGLTVNLSYWIFPAFPSLDELVPSPRWRALERSGLYLLQVARFGSGRLPSDWMVLTATKDGGLIISLLKDKPLYGYDAVRIPLYLLWDGRISPRTAAPFLAFWQSTSDTRIPASVNLATGAVARYAIPPGMQAIVTAVETRSPPAEPGFATDASAPLPALDRDQDYYSAALGLLVRLALSETD
jgi:endoglucanase